MTKITHLGKYALPGKGGIESVTHCAAYGAAHVGMKVDVISFTDGRREVCQIEGRYSEFCAPVLFVKSSQPVSLWYLYWAVRRGRNADVVHLHVPNMLAALSAPLLGKKPKLVVHWHSDVIGKGLIGRLLKPLERVMLKRADRIICTSLPYARASSDLRSVQGKIEIIPIGMPDRSLTGTVITEHLPPDLIEKVGGRRIVLSIGRFVPYKGFHVLVEAAAQLPEDTVVVIVGAGPLELQLRARIASLGLDGKVILAGKLDDQVLDSLLRRAELFCLPSVEKSEAFGVVLVEAMSFGLPIVATNIPGSGVPWVNEDHVSGLNVAVGDARSLATACIAILGSTELRTTLSHGARQRFEREFTEALFVQRVIALYRNVLLASSV